VLPWGDRSATYVATAQERVVLAFEQEPAARLCCSAMPDLPAGHVAEVIASLHRAFVVALARGPGAEERNDARVHWVIGGSPAAFFNCVVRADLDARDVDEVIVHFCDRCRARGVPGTWHVDAAMRPRDLGQRLLAHGFTDVGDDRGMALDPARAVPTPPAPPGLTIELVDDLSGLAEWATALAAGFEFPAAWGSWFFERCRMLGFAGSAPWRHWLGRLDGRPVGTATIVVARDASSLHNISTVPSARRQGIGAALTSAALAEARARGHRLAVLHASELGAPVYRRLGFQSASTTALYRWSPG
jgi:ribosomal protein S18 acetylase RimI-like enzyme